MVLFLDVVLKSLNVYLLMELSGSSEIWVTGHVQQLLLPITILLAGRGKVGGLREEDIFSRRRRRWWWD